MITSLLHKPTTRYNGWLILAYVQKETHWNSGNPISIGSMLRKRLRMPLGNTIATITSRTGLLTRSVISSRQGHCRYSWTILIDSMSTLRWLTIKLSTSSWTVSPLVSARPWHIMKTSVPTHTSGRRNSTLWTSSPPTSSRRNKMREVKVKARTVICTSEESWEENSQAVRSRRVNLC